MNGYKVSVFIYFIFTVVLIDSQHDTLEIHTWRLP
jgi:hypothetical protein